MVEISSGRGSMMMVTRSHEIRDKKTARIGCHRAYRKLYIQMVLGWDAFVVSLWLGQPLHGCWARYR